MPTVVLSTPLQSRIGAARVDVDAATVGDALRAVEADHPPLSGWLLDDRGRLREHVNAFVAGHRVELDHPLADGDEIFVIQAISGGSGRIQGYRSRGEVFMSCELLVGTRKGLLILSGERGGELAVAHRAFEGQTCDYAVRDRRSGLYFAAVTHDQFGPHLHRASDPTGEWEQVEGPAFPEGEDASVSRIWTVEPGEEDGVLWAGVAPAALFKSTDGGATWELNRALWNQPSRPEWEGGAGGLCLHSICTWPGDRDRLAIGISAVGVWLTEDGGETWRRGVEGLVPRYLPEEARDGTLMHCVHSMRRHPAEPETLYMQFHGGVYRSDDAGASWTEIGLPGGLPADFGFPIEIDPGDPDAAWVIPLTADVDRVTHEGKVRVYETRDRGASWSARTDGLPQSDAYLTILRQAFCRDDGAPLGLYFGTESGELFASADGGAHWTAAARHLPPIVSVRASG